MMPSYSCTSCSTVTSTHTLYYCHLSSHQELGKPTCPVSALETMMMVEATLPSCPDSLQDRYRVTVKEGTIRSAVEIQEEDDRVVNNFLQIEEVVNYCIKL